MTFLDAYAAESLSDHHDEDHGSSAAVSSAPSLGACYSAGVAEASRPLDVFWPHVPQLRRYLLRRVPPSDVEDVIQDVFLAIVRRADAATVSHPRRYLFRAADATLIDRHRRQTARRFSQHCDLNEAADPVDQRSPLRILLARDDVRAAENVLRQLPARTQEIIVAIRLEGMSLKSLARRYNVSTSAIEKHVTKASKALAQIRDHDLVGVATWRSSPLRERYLSGSI